MAFSKHGKFWYSHETWKDYEKVPWHTINDSSRRKVMKNLLPKPAACPVCGKPGAVNESGMERVLLLCNRSGKLLRAPDDWYWICRDCHREANRKAKQRYPVIQGTKVKPWVGLTRKGKVYRIKRVLPMPASCPYCDSTTVELVSRSGKWPEDINDYVWCCRKHARVFTQLANYHTAKTPWLRARERQYIIECLHELFPHWTNSNSMGGSFKGYSILNKTSAGGRFYTISDTFFRNWLRSMPYIPH